MDKAMCCLNNMLALETICELNPNELNKCIEHFSKEFSQHPQFKQCEHKSKRKDKDMPFIEDNNKIILIMLVLAALLLIACVICICI